MKIVINLVILVFLFISTTISPDYTPLHFLMLDYFGISHQIRLFINITMISIFIINNLKLKEFIKSNKESSIYVLFFKGRLIFYILFFILILSNKSFYWLHNSLYENQEIFYGSNASFIEYRSDGYDGNVQYNIHLLNTSKKEIIFGIQIADNKLNSTFDFPEIVIDEFFSIAPKSKLTLSGSLKSESINELNAHYRASDPEVLISINGSSYQPKIIDTKFNRILGRNLFHCLYIYYLFKISSLKPFFPDFT